MKTVKLIKRVMGLYNIGGAVGETIEVSAEIAEQMVKTGHAEIVETKETKKADKK